MSSLLLRQNNEAIRIFFLKTKLLFICKIDQNFSYYEEVYWITFTSLILRRGCIVNCYCESRKFMNLESCKYFVHFKKKHQKKKPNRKNLQKTVCTY